ncbi:hypothetical protein GPX89_09100 [Nocardia sp. ET3-3]|uniref:Uncharacterized protein n=1 Tax=Nocardia terrae TaxID=2675851 RepID=A0A7K1USS5_9NOCA|nr:hypothetical protein [Nocardia terrae]MVU77403.1 hypothetical protein [Nocardia terrae]
MDYRFLILLVVVMAVLLLRCTRWKTEPTTRPITVTLAVLALVIVLHLPGVIGDRWLHDHTPEFLDFANWTNLLADLLMTALAGFSGALVARAWRLERLVPLIAAVTLVAAVSLIFVWQASDASQVATPHIGDLGGAATWYTVLSASAITLAGLMICASVVLATNMPWRLRLALIPMAAASAAGAAIGLMHLAGALTHPGQPFTDPSPATFTGTMGVACYAVSGLLDHVVRRNVPSTREEQREPAATVHC